LKRRATGYEKKTQKTIHNYFAKGCRVKLISKKKNKNKKWMKREKTLK